MAPKEFDVVLCGATGFVGRQTVSYFVQHAPAGLRWAIAGRNLHKLRALGVDVPILVFDSMQQDQVDILVARTRIIVSTAGPFRISTAIPSWMRVSVWGPTTLTAVERRRASAI